MGGENVYRRMAAELLPTIKEVCAAEGAPYQVCFAEVMVHRLNNAADLVKRHNYFHLRYPRGHRARELWESLGRPARYTKMTSEWGRIRGEEKLRRLRATGALFSDVYDREPTYGGRVHYVLPLDFCAFTTMRAGVTGWVRWMRRRRYEDGGAFTHDPVRWVAYRWMRGHSTSQYSVEAFVKRMRRCAAHLGDQSFMFEIDGDLQELLDEARGMTGRDRWDLARAALERNGFTRVPYEVVDFSE